MSTVSITAATTPSVVAKYRATGDNRETTGDTPGAALAALAALLGPAVPGRLIVVVEPADDDSLAADRRRRLDELKQLYRASESGRATMSAVERAEMEQLLDAVFAASERRASALAGEPNR